MHLFHLLKLRPILQWVILSLCLTVALALHAEPAPVYDADSLAQSDDSSVEANQSDAVGTGDQEGTFVPVQSGPPFAGVSETEATEGMSLEQRMHRAEQQISNMQSTDMAARMDSMQNQMQALRDQIEQLTHQLQQLQQKGVPVPAASQTKTAATTADEEASKNHKNGASKVGKGATAEVAAAAKTNDNQPDVAEEQQIYQKAYSLIKAKKYSDAVDALQGMLKKYPSGQFASNAHYWLGELYGVMGKNDQALKEFGTVVSNYPDSPRISDAQLKVGIIYAAQLKWSAAKSAFHSVINHYPGTNSARLASEQLKQIKQAGH